MQPSSIPRRVLGTGVLFVLAMVAWWWIVGRETELERPGSKRTSASALGSASAPSGPTGSIRALSTDPATPPLEWGREDVVVTLPDEVPPLHELVEDEASLEEMMELLDWALSAGQGGEAGLEMARCAARFEPRLESKCGWEMQAVLHRRSEDAGEIVYARATVTTGAEQAACPAFASCWSKAWADREPVPMPRRVGDELAFSQWGRSSMWDPSKGMDAVAYYRGVAEREQAQVDELTAVARAPTQVTPSSLGWNILFARHRADEAKCMVEVLEGREGGGGR